MQLAVARWDTRLAWVRMQHDPHQFARTVQPRLIQLVDERLRNLLRSACDDDRVERRRLGPARVTIADSRADMRVTERLMARRGTLAQRPLDLDRVDLFHKAREDRRLIARPGTDLVNTIRRLGIERLPARKSEQPMRERRRTPCRALRGRDITVDLVQPALAEAGLQQLERAHDAGQQIVEVVRDAAGQLADRLHLLALAQRRLVTQLLGHVDGAHHRAAAGH